MHINTIRVTLETKLSRMNQSLNLQYSVIPFSAVGPRQDRGPHPGSHTRCCVSTCLAMFLTVNTAPHTSHAFILRRTSQAPVSLPFPNPSSPPHPLKCFAYLLLRTHKPHLPHSFLPPLPPSSSPPIHDLS